MGFVFCAASGPRYSDVGLLRYHVKSMVTDDDEIDKLTQWKAVSEQYCWGFHPQHPRITNFEEKGCSLIVDNVRWVLYSLFRFSNVNVTLVFSC